MEFHQAVSPMLEAVSGPHQSRSHISLTDTSVTHETSRSGLVPFPLSSQLCPLGWHRIYLARGTVGCCDWHFYPLSPSRFSLPFLSLLSLSEGYKSDLKNQKHENFGSVYDRSSSEEQRPFEPQIIQRVSRLRVTQRPGFLRQGEAGNLSLRLAKLPTPRGTCGDTGTSLMKSPSGRFICKVVKIIYWPTC